MRVQGDHLELQLVLDVEGALRTVQRTYPYDLDERGFIFLHASSNDRLFVEGFLRTSWQWTGERIVRREGSLDQSAPVVDVLELGAHEGAGP